MDRGRNRRRLRIFDIETLAAAATGAPPVTPGPQPDETVDDAAHRWSAIGEEHFVRSEFEAAARAWVTVASLFDETRVTREERETVMLIALEAYRQSPTVPRENPGEGKAVFGEALAVALAYEQTYREVYGPAASASLEFLDSVERLKALRPEHAASLSCDPPDPTA